METWDTFVRMNKFKNRQTTTFAYWEMVLSTTILPSLVVIVKAVNEISIEKEVINFEEGMKYSLSANIYATVEFVKKEVEENTMI